MCARCGEDKGIEEFRERRRGKRVWRDAYCKPCEKEYQREYYQRTRERKLEYTRQYAQAVKADPVLGDLQRARHAEYMRKRRQPGDPYYERYRANERVRYQRIKNDPKRWEDTLERQRLYYRMRREQEGKPVRRQGKEDTSQQRLPVQPLREWLESLNGDLANLSEVSGVDPRAIHRVRFESERVTMAFADQLLTAMGVGLWELYPELYD